jgi:PAS domain S-box-containing protein
VFVNGAGVRMLGATSPEEVLGRSVMEFVHPDGRSFLADRMQFAMAGYEAPLVEQRFVRLDGTPIDVEVAAMPFTYEDRRAVQVVVRDITERKRAEDRQRLLSAEVDHRAKNLLATIQAIVLLTKSDARTVGDFAKTIIGRLHALGRAHDLLARDSWTGASLRDIIRNEAQAFGADGARLSVLGEDVYLSPRPAQTLSLALHELTTNAAKHGALSVPQGRVEIRLTVTGPELQLAWTETGGPKVKPPRSQGFGTAIIERSVAHELGGKAEVHYEPSGLHCDIRIPLRSVSRQSPGM